MDLQNVYQFTCIKTVCPNPADISQTQQIKEVVYGQGLSMVAAVKNFEEKMKGHRLEIVGLGIVGQLAF